jgi:hypothetical protein
MDNALDLNNRVGTVGYDATRRDRHRFTRNPRACRGPPGRNASDDG